MALLEAVGTAVFSWIWSAILSKFGVNRAILNYRRRILNTNSEVLLSKVLLEIKAFYDTHPKILMRPHLQEFYDAWCVDYILDSTAEHSRFAGIADIPSAVMDLKRDAVRLLRP